jgi:hypothetical protein
MLGSQTKEGCSSPSFNPQRGGGMDGWGDVIRMTDDALGDQNRVVAFAATGDRVVAFAATRGYDVG